MADPIMREEWSVLHDASREARDRSSDMRQRSREACEHARRLVKLNKILRARCRVEPAE
jgi:hypothetical protein